MELTTGLNQVMVYTEQCLKDELDVEKIAQLCGCSYIDFQRLFSLLNNMSYLEYVKARRLSQAAVEIVHSRKRILDIALEYGYESGDVFAAAFRRAFGCSSSKARKENAQLQLFMPRTFDITIHGNHDIMYEIKQTAVLRLSGRSVISSIKENRSIKFWDDVKADGTLQDMMKKAESPVSYGLCFGYDRDGNNRYMIAVATCQRTLRYLNSLQQNGWFFSIPALCLPDCRHYGNLFTQKSSLRAAMTEMKIWIPINRR